MSTRRNGKFRVAKVAAIPALLLCGMTAAGAEPESPSRSSLKQRVPEIQKLIADSYQHLEALYKHLHTHPELSLQEVQTSARLVQELRPLGFEVTANVGGHGVVGVLKNGPGPTVLVRTDMDALPVVEQTGLPYASKVRARDKNGNDVGVMHACGHDMHMTIFTGTARVLAGMRDRGKERWSSLASRPRRSAREPA